jgi:ABC-type phosphate transport system auxiliary subunit
MKKYLKLLITVGSILSILVLASFFSFLSINRDSSPKVVVIAIDRELSQFKIPFDMEEASYHNQLDELNKTLQEQQTLYRAQMEMLNTQLITTQNWLKELQLEEQNLQLEVTRLRITQVERRDVYQTQLQHARNQHNERLAQLQSRLARVQIELAEVNDRLLRQ